MYSKVTMKIFILTIIMLTVFPSMPYAQWNFTAGSYSTIDDNSFRNYNKISDVYQTFYLNIFHDKSYNNSNLRTYYNGLITFFNEYDSRNYSLHTGGIVLTMQLINQDYILNTGLKVSSLHYNGFYSIFENKSLNFYSNLRFILGNLTLLGGITGKFDKYNNLKSQNVFETEVFINAQKFFNTRTSLQYRMTYGHQYYFKSMSFKDDNLLIENKSDFSDVIGFDFTAAQSITDLTGISLSFHYSKPVNSAERYVKINSDYIYSEEEIFNDPADYTLHGFSLQITKLFDNGITAQLISSYQKRDYLDMEAFDLNGNLFDNVLLRKDRRKTINVSISKDIFLSSQNDKTLSAGFSLWWLQNLSNDPYYKYNNILTSFDISFSY